MKAGIGLVALVSIAVAASLWFGDRLLASRHTLTKYNYPLTSQGPLTGATVQDGLNAALRKCGLDPANWSIPLLSWDSSMPPPWQEPRAARSLLIVLTNQADATQLYVRVERIDGRALHYHVYRPK